MDNKHTYLSISKHIITLSSNLHLKKISMSLFSFTATILSLGVKNLISRILLKLNVESVYFIKVILHFMYTQNNQ